MAAAMSFFTDQWEFNYESAIRVPAMLEGGRRYHAALKSRIVGTRGEMTFDSLRDSRKGFDGSRSRYTPGARVGPHMHARTAYHASSRDVTPGYNRPGSAGRRGVKGRVKKRPR